MKKYNGTLLLQYDPIHYTWIVFSLTDSKVELDEYFKDALDFIIQIISKIYDQPLGRTSCPKV